MRKAYQPWIDEMKETHAEFTGRVEGQIPSRRPATRKRMKTHAAFKKRIAEKPKSTKEAFELVKADGHWHRIAEVINARMNEVYPSGGGETPVARKKRVTPFTRLHSKIVGGAKKVRSFFKRRRAMTATAKRHATAVQQRKEQLLATQAAQGVKVGASPGWKPSPGVEMPPFDPGAHEREAGEQGGIGAERPTGTTIPPDETLKDAEREAKEKARKKKGSLMGTLKSMATRGGGALEKLRGLLRGRGSGAAKLRGGPGDLEDVA